MKKNLLYSLFVVLLFSNSYGQNLWNKVSDEKLGQTIKMERASMPSKYKLFALDLAALKSKLLLAPLDSQNEQSNVTVAFPDAEGNLNYYKIYEAPVMELELANKFPDIKSYIGKGIDDPTATIRFSVTLFGLHTMTLSAKTGTAFIDTYTKDLKNYIVYSKSNTVPSRSFQCLVNESFELPSDMTNNLPNLTQRASDGQFRTFRLAMACTIEYAAFHVNAAGLNAGTIAQKKAAVLAAMNVTMTRVNGIYERDMSMRMTLVGTNDQVIFIDSDDFSNDVAGALIDESQAKIDEIILPANYDIGHTVSTGGGGLAQLFSPCSASKARGITGSPAPVGDPYDIDYVAHEIGHQFGANHTFAGDADNCGGGNRNNATGVEPGSGTTIMAYAGICSPQNVQNNSDTYFHAVSIAEMSAFVAGAGNCSVNTANANSAPVVNAGADYTIPRGTAFMLTGNATDANGDALIYCWEQTDFFRTFPAIQASSSIPSATVLSGPNFKSNPPVTSPSRYFPALASVVAGNLAPTWEVIPTVARTMNFALTVRDNRAPNGGQTGRDNMIVTVGSAAPFNVTSQATGVSWTQNTTETITWNVSGTTAAPYNSTNVNILLSTDNGVTFSTLLANTPNDGSQLITVPNIAAPYCKIMVQSVGNVFYAVNAGNIAIGYVVTTTTTCTNYTRTFSPAVAMATNWTAYNLPSAAGVTDSYIISDANLTIVSTDQRTNQVSFGLVKPGSGTVDIVAFDGPTSGCSNTSVNLNAVFDDEGVVFNCVAPATGAAYKPVSVLSSLDGLNSAGNWRLAAKSTNVANTITSATLTLCHTETTVTLASESFGLQDFTLYPNPNNGSFTVKFNSTSSNNIKIGVYDMRGREIFNKSYQNEGLFNQNLQLDKVQSGIYLVTVQDGDRKEVKRIVVE